MLAVVTGFVLNRRPMSPTSIGQPPGHYWLGEPGLWLGVVTVLIFANQVLVNIYIIRVHGGDPSFVARYLPSGYFDLADHDPAIGWLARHFPDPALLAPSVLRVPALLELPFGLLAYLTVARWFDDRLYARLTGTATIWAASIAYSIVFGLVEWDLRNPYTWSDLVLRGVSAIATALGIRWVGRHAGRREWRTVSASGLLAFAVSAAGMGVLVLCAYDSVLLYNLGRVGRDAPIALVAALVLIAARWAATRVSDSGGPLVSIETSLLGTGLAMFFVPALPIRYGIQFGTPAVAIAAVAVIAVTATVDALRSVPPRHAGRAALVGAGALVCAVVALALPARYSEIRILAAAAVATIMATALAFWSDRRTATR